MKQWPAQVITYKYGANRILRWKEKKRKIDEDFDEKAFHQKVLENGSLPLAVLQRQFEE